MRTENYDFRSIEAKWQKIWNDSHESWVMSHESEVLATPRTMHDSRPKFYCLVMFPYPSGKIHMGHARNYCIGDVIARYKRMLGFQVLHPIAWDAFGLPAENAAIEHGADPEKWTRQNISEMRKDIKSLGISYNWEREFATCDPEYYRWNQWFFVQMFKRGLAVRRKSEVNWCVNCETVLANEQVHDGKCWRCHSEIKQKELEQWFFKITDYAERLLADLELLKGKWPEEVILMQRHWIGKSIGAEIHFEIAKTSPESWVMSPESKEPRLTTHDPPLSLKVFTTRPDTLFGCTFLVLSPEHPLLSQMLDTRCEMMGDYSSKSKIKEYCEEAKKKSRIERTTIEREKRGVFTGLYAVNPVNNQKVPIWIADYVLAEYGTGAIMAVPAHDQRDFEFAKKYDLPIIEVIRDSHESWVMSPESKDPRPPLKEAYEGEGVLGNSGEFSGMSSEEAKKKITEWLSKKEKGKESVTYRIRDWLISRQRYWGTPIPVVYCAKCGTVPVAETDLPVVLPKNVNFTGKGKSPLAQVREFVNTKCPKCGGSAKREIDTMDTFVDSSWYFLRYCDPSSPSSPPSPLKGEGSDKTSTPLAGEGQGEGKPFDSDKVNFWMPVDQYIGGIEHACMHLIYSRFFHKVLYDMGLVESKEPFSHLLTQGMVTMGGSAMSKSKGNIVPVEKMVEEYGADTARLFVLFASPPKNQLEWSEEGVHGCWRFLNRVCRMAQKIAKGSHESWVMSPESKIKDARRTPHDARQLSICSLERKTHWAIKKVQEDIEKDFQFNTAIAALMELLNELSDYPALGDETSKESFRALLTLLYPFAPHLSSEAWENLHYEPKNLERIAYPSYDPKILIESKIEIVIQVNGKLKTKFSIEAEESQNEARVVASARQVLAEKGLNDSFENYKFVPGRLINFVTAPHHLPPSTSPSPLGRRKG